jgi:leucyl aminopeptidase
MIDSIFNFPAPFAAKSGKKQTVEVFFLNQKSFKSWLKKQKKVAQTQIEENGFDGSSGQAYDLKNAQGETQAIIAALQDPVHYLDSAAAAAFIQKNFSTKFVGNHVFEIASEHPDEELEKICIGWGLAAYRFDHFKEDKRSTPVLLTPKGVDKTAFQSHINAVCLVRNLINLPANILGTDDLAKAAQTMAKSCKGQVKVISDKATIQDEFPLIYAVGKASPRKPQLVELTWGEKKHPKVTIVGKGIVYDTGGLNLKPGKFMRDMKKDMGGAAHALGLARLIMDNNVPVNLRVLLPVAENSVAGNSFRPGDILDSRKGLTVEIGDTDAEGRLVVADALTYACEKKPDLLIDFCTLTGAARVALGYDIPAFFANREEIIDGLRVSSVKADDAIWPLPLWEGYKKELSSDVADLCNDGSGRAGAIHGGLFLQHFVDPSVDWIHLDCYAWEQHGRPGRPKGGADTGMRAMYDYITRRYA